MKRKLMLVFWSMVLRLVYWDWHAPDKVKALALETLKEKAATKIK
jgi:hypothetical protein